MENQKFLSTTWRGCTKTKKIDTAIVVAPKGVYRNWQVSEIPAHLRDDIEHEVYVWNPNPNKSQKEHLLSGIEERSKLRILLVNVEGFATPKVRAFVEKFVRGSTFLLAVDESTTIKNPKAKRTKALVALGKAASFRRILTGSPVTKSPMDLYAQCGFMDKVPAWFRVVLFLSGTIRNYENSTDGRSQFSASRGIQKS